MEREELLTKINEKLGSTKLTLSERTVNDFLDDALSGITDDASVTDDYLTRKASLLKSIDGNLHSDVSAQVELYKKNYKPAEPKAVEQKTEEQPKANSELEEKFAKLQNQFQEMMAQRDSERAAADKARLTENAVNRLKDKFRNADVSVNSYILKQTMRDMQVEGSENVEDLVKSIESSYYQNLKEAGIEYDSPMNGDTNAVNKKAENAKSKRDALRKEMRARGYLPKDK